MGLENLSKRKPIQLVIGPGRMGRKLPKIPKPIKQVANIIRNISIYSFLFKDVNLQNMLHKVNI